jgi:two-component system sensor histidine kinase KdpD
MLLEDRSGKKPVQWRGYLIGPGLVALATLLGHLVQAFLAPANIIMIYPLCVTISAIVAGLGPSILVAILSVLAFDFFFVTPYYTFAVDDTQYIFTFIVLLLVGMIISYLTSRVRQQTETAKLRERETATLYALDET